MKNSENGKGSGIGSAPEMIESNTTSAVTNNQVELTQFMEEKSGVNVDIGSDNTYTVGDESQAVDVKDFLKRPVQIRTINWPDGGSFSTPIEFFPWELYFNDPVVKRKLDNYYLLKANLKVKFVINASPFYYGFGMFAYQPLFEFEQNFDFSTNPDYFDFELLTQKPHMYVYPQSSQGGEMTLPFVYHKEWLDCTSQADLQNMGKMVFRTLDQLRNANGIVGSGVSIQVYAYAEDVMLAGPTRRLALQAGDEYSDSGVVSKPASAIARAAGQLEELPVIGPFATATRMVSSVVGGIASIFGFTRVPVIDDVHAYQTKTHPNLAATDIGAPIEKLTIDAKNELSIDPKICGVPLSDEMNISSFVMREAYVGITSWTAAQLPGEVLNTWLINPGYTNTVSRTNETFVKHFPMSYVSKLFEFWRGDIIIRFKIICSQYHRGRLQFYWDPIQQFNASVDPSQTNYNKIVDITENTDIEIRIPYTQPTAYLSTYRNDDVVWSDPTPRIPTVGRDNGVFGMRVLTRQTSPVASADIQILTFIRGADNLEFAGPVQIDDELSPYQVQSGEMDLDKVSTNIGLADSKPQKEINLIYMGEAITSFRQLFNRAVLYFTNLTGDTVGAAIPVIGSNAILPRLNLFPGFDPNGVFTANQLTGVSTAPYNFVCWSVQSWISLCFVGTRGSMTYFINPISASPEEPSIVQFFRRPDLTVTSVGPFVRNETTLNAFAREYSRVNRSMAGLCLTNAHTQTGISAVIPMYNNYKFQMNNPLTRTNGSVLDNSNQDRFEASVETTPFNPSASDRYPGFQLYTCAGPDFSLIFFSGVQPIYRYASLPTGA